MGGGAVDNEWKLTYPSNVNRTILLVGRTGNGKSATGNSILRRTAFTSKPSSSGVTSLCELQTALLPNGQTISVIDTPGLFDFSGDVGKEIVKCVDLGKDGIHAILIIFSVRTRFSQEEEATISTLQNLFGSRITDFMIVVFTGGDELESEDSLDEYLGRDCPDPLKNILNLCGNRCLLFDNKTKNYIKMAQQVEQLLSLVNGVLIQNGGQPYTSELFVELKKEAMKLHEKEAEVDALKGCSESKILELKEQIQRSYDVQLKAITDGFASKLNKKITGLEKRLAEEHAARVKAEEKARREIVPVIHVHGGCSIL